VQAWSPPRSREAAQAIAKWSRWLWTMSKLSRLRAPRDSQQPTSRRLEVLVRRIVVTQVSSTTDTSPGAGSFESRRLKSVTSWPRRNQASSVKVAKRHARSRRTLWRNAPMGERSGRCAIVTNQSKRILGRPSAGAPGSRLEHLHDRVRTCRWCRSATLSENRRHAPNWVATVYHGIPLDTLTPRTEPATIWHFSVGSPEKGWDTAIDVARRAGMPNQDRRPKSRCRIPRSSVRRDWEYYTSTVEAAAQGR